MANNKLVVRPDIQTVLTVKCEAPVDNRDIILRANFIKIPHICEWICTVKIKQKGMLEISLTRSNTGAERYCEPMAGVQALRIVSGKGQHLFYERVDGVKEGFPMTARVTMASVIVAGLLFFDIILSTSSSSYLIAATKEHAPCPLAVHNDDEHDKLQEDKDAEDKEKVDTKELAVDNKSEVILSSLMRDLATTNMAFTFGFNGSARNVALWVHQSVIAHQPYMASFIDKLQDIEGSGESPTSGVKSTHVTEYSIESYCCLIRFLYSGSIDLEVNLSDFAIGCPPKKPYSAENCKKRPAIEGFFSPAAGTATKDVSDEIKNRTDWHELFQLADCYEVKELREHCKSKIVASITEENALETLFKFAYRYADLKSVLLQFVAENVDKLFVRAQGKDPFEVYKDHPEQHSLLIQALQLKFKVMA